MSNPLLGITNRLVSGKFSPFFKYTIFSIIINVYIIRYIHLETEENV